MLDLDPDEMNADPQPCLEDGEAVRALVQAAQAHRHLLAEEDVLVRVEALDGTEAGRLRPVVHQPAEVPRHQRDGEYK